MQNIENEFKPYHQAISKIMKKEYRDVKIFFTENPAQLSSSRVVKYGTLGFFSCFFLNKIDICGVEYDMEGKHAGIVKLPDEQCEGSDTMASIA